MRISRENRLFMDMVILAQKALEEMTDEEIHEHYCSDYYAELRKYLSEVFNIKENGGLK